MSLAPHIEHNRYSGAIYSTHFYGEREALGRSGFLRPLLPPEDREYITLNEAILDGDRVSNRVNSCHRKHGGIKIRVIWATHGWGLPICALTDEEIIDLSRLVLAEIQEHDQDRINAAPEGWPFPVWGIAA